MNIQKIRSVRLKRHSTVCWHPCKSGYGLLRDMIRSITKKSTHQEGVVRLRRKLVDRNTLYRIMIKISEQLNKFLNNYSKKVQ